ncbi:MAG: phosphoribosyl-AMP cyclohydrolase [Chloroflexota bacterium]
MLQFKENGLLPAVVQHAETGEVLMVGYMNPESVRLTLETGDVWFYSRSRQQLWHKGATSGDYFRVCEVRTDCDEDAILVKVLPEGAACHTGAPSCFFNVLDASRLPQPAG